MPTSTPDFASRVLLVHPLQANSILLATDEQLVFTDNNDFDLMQTLINAYIKKSIMLTDEAVIGSHLRFAQTQYTNSFVDRPHIHWWWNGLFHANSGGNWEDSLFAWLEPMDQFSHLIGCAPYDTMTVGSHKLSNASCILVPQICVEALSERLKAYQGNIIGYDHQTVSLRQAINATIKQYYPDTLQLTNKDGKDINEPELCNNNWQFNSAKCQEYDYDHHAGYFKALYVKDEQDQITPLMKGAATIQSADFQAYAQGRFIGLHQGAPTDVERNPIIKTLKAASHNPALTNGDNFIAHARNADLLCILEAYKVYQTLIVFNENTGAHDYAHYLIKKALIADFISLGTVPVEYQTLSEIIEPNYGMLLNSVRQFAHAPGKQALQTYRATCQNLLAQHGLGTHKVDYTPSVRSPKYHKLAKNALMVDKQTQAAFTFIHNAFMDYSKAYMGNETLASFARFFSGRWRNNYGSIVTTLLLKPEYSEFNETNLKQFYAELKQQIDINTINPYGDVYAMLLVAEELTDISFFATENIAAYVDIV